MYSKFFRFFVLVAFLLTVIYPLFAQEGDVVSVTTTEIEAVKDINVQEDIIQVEETDNIVIDTELSNDLFINGRNVSISEKVEDKVFASGKNISILKRGKY